MKIGPLFLLAFILLLFSQEKGGEASLIFNEIHGYSSRLLKFDPSTGRPSKGPGVMWYDLTFDDSQWTTTSASISETLPAGARNSLYLRCTFSATASDVANTNNMVLSIDWADGFIAYLNGKEMMRKNMGTSTQYGWFDAASFTPRTTSGSITFNPDSTSPQKTSDYLVSGTNVFAIQIHNDYYYPIVTDSSIKALFTLSTSGGKSYVTTSTTTCKKFYGFEEPAATFDPTPTSTGIYQQGDWVEIYNNDTSIVDITGYSFTDDNALKQKWTFPSKTTIPAKSYLLVFCDSLNYKGKYLHTNWGISNSGEKIYIYGKDLKEVASIDLPTFSAFHTYGLINGQYLYLSEPTPGAANKVNQVTYLGVLDPPIIGLAGGFYASGIVVSITTNTIGATIRYTLNGVDPSSTTSFSTYTSPLTITTTTVLIADVVLNGYISSPTSIETYLIYPVGSSVRNISAVVLTGDPGRALYKPDGIFSISGGYISNGLWTCAETDYTAYNIPENRGQWTERPAALAIYHPAYKGLDNVPTMKIGLRFSASDWSRGRAKLTFDSPMNDNNLWSIWSFEYKPSTNIYFTSDYGSSKVDGKIIPYSKYLAHKRFRMRAGKNDIFNPFIMDEFVRRVYGDTGQPSTTGFLNTLFVNGVLKGAFNFVQKVDEFWLEQVHNVPQSAEWDMFKLTDDWESGDNTYMLEMKNFAISNSLSTLSNYKTFIDKYVHIDSIIDYLLVNAYFGTWDWPLNNAYIVRQRTTGDSGKFRFYMWDAEGAYADGRTPTSYNTFSSDLDNSAATNSLNDQYTIPTVWQFLKTSSEFKFRWADRAQLHFSRNGALTQQNLLNRWTQLRNEYIPLMALVSSSTTFSSSRFDNWYPSRTATFFSQMQAIGLWQTSLLVPQFSPDGASSSSAITVTITNPNGKGTIYYNLKGGDPRDFGGALSATASTYSAALTITKPTRLCARVRDSSTSTWSPIDCVSFSIAGAYTIAISEIMYSPEGGKSYEFTELKNTGQVDLDMTNIAFLIDGLSSYQFPDGTIIPGNAYYVIAYEPDTFLGTYGWLADARSLRNLPGSGTLTLINTLTQNVILNLTYGDSYPWPPITKGLSFSLVPIDDTPDDVRSSNYTSPTRWRASTNQGGSPSMIDPDPISWPSIKLNEVSPNPTTGNDWIELYNPTNTAVDLSYWYLTDEFSLPRKYQFPNGTSIAAKSYMTTSILPVEMGFSLGSSGDSVWLFNGLGDKLLGYYHGFKYQSAPTSDMTYARYSDCLNYDYFAISSGQSNGLPNQPPLYPKLNSIIISAVDLRVVSGVTQWIELKWISDVAVDLRGWYLEKGTGNTIFNFTTSTSVPAWGTVRIYATSSPPSLANVISRGPLLIVLDPAGQFIVLKKPTGEIAANLYYRLTDSPAWPSEIAGPVYLKDYLRVGNDPCSWQTTAPSELQLKARVFFDKNMDGVFNGNDSGIAGVKGCVERLNNGVNEKKICITSDNDGWFRYSNALYYIVSSVWNYSIVFGNDDPAIGTSVQYPLAATSSYEWKATAGSATLANQFPVTDSPFKLEGYLKDQKGPLANVEITLDTGSSPIASFTNTDGYFVFSENEYTIPSGLSLLVTANLTRQDYVWTVVSNNGWMKTSSGSLISVTVGPTSYGRAISPTNLNLTLTHSIITPTVPTPPSSSPSSSPTTPTSPTSPTSPTTPSTSPSSPTSPSSHPTSAPSNSSHSDDNKSENQGLLGIGEAASWGVIGAIIAVVIILIVIAIVVSKTVFSGSREVV